MDGIVLQCIAVITNNVKKEIEMESTAQQETPKTDVTLPVEDTNGSNGNSKTDAQPTEEKKKSSPIKVDFSKPKTNNSPFKKAESLEKRPKIFIYGDFGTGKTPLALSMPGVVMIDTEKGSEPYNDQFDFHVLPANNSDEISNAVDWLLKNKHPYKTLVIDPITVYWESLQKKWSDIFLKRNKGSKGFKFDFYDLQSKDWMVIKTEYKDFMRKLSSLDMNLVVTAREKTKYKEGTFMVGDGVTFDGEKSLPYLFDTVIHLHKDKNGKRIATCLRDRNRKIPEGLFDPSYEALENLIGKKVLNRKVKSVAYITSDQKKTLCEFLETSGCTSEQIQNRLHAYGAEDLDSLTKENAETIINKFREVHSK